jgi:ABC-type transporter Mla subunit MlaD
MTNGTTAIRVPIGMVFLLLGLVGWLALRVIRLGSLSWRSRSTGLIASMDEEEPTLG